MKYEAICQFTSSRTILLSKEIKGQHYVFPAAAVVVGRVCDHHYAIGLSHHRVVVGTPCCARTALWSLALSRCILVPKPAGSECMATLSRFPRGVAALMIYLGSLRGVIWGQIWKISPKVRQPNWKSCSR